MTQTFKGPWIDVEPWQKWILKKMESNGLTCKAMAVKMEVTEQSLYRWRKAVNPYVTVSKVEDALWAYDYLNIHEELGDIQLYYEHPLTKERDQNKYQAGHRYGWFGHQDPGEIP